MADSAAVAAVSGGLAIASAGVTQLFAVRQQRARWAHEKQQNLIRTGERRRQELIELCAALLAAADKSVACLDEAMHTTGKERAAFEGHVRSILEAFAEKIELVRLTASTATDEAAALVSEQMKVLIQITNESDEPAAREPAAMDALVARFAEAHQQFVRRRTAFIQSVKLDVA
jgi:hypothetical protein